MTEPENVKFFDMPRDLYPFYIELIDESNGEVFWDLNVDAPGSMTIPGKNTHHREAVTVRITYGDGSTSTLRSDQDNPDVTGP